MTVGSVVLVSADRRDGPVTSTVRDRPLKLELVISNSVTVPILIIKYTVNLDRTCITFSTYRAQLISPSPSGLVHAQA